MITSPFVIALDGVAGAGKSSTAKALSRRLGIIYLDTGAMYRSLTLFCLRKNIKSDDATKITEVAKSLSFEFPSNGSIWVNSEDVSTAIRTPEVSSQVSHYCIHPTARAILVDVQRSIASELSAVLDGRDIGTVVFPSTPFKFFLWASPEARAKRRVLEMREQGIEANEQDVLKNIQERDHLDSTRAHSPLQKAGGAVTIDTTFLTFDEQVEKIANAVISGLEQLQSINQPTTSTHRSF